MKTEIIQQCFIFFVFMFNGLIIGIIFDFFRTLRKSFKTKDFITYIQDILFWIISGSITLYLIFNFNNGELRAYVFIALIIGTILYMLFCSKLIMKINLFCIIKIKKIIKILLIPINFFIKIIIAIKRTFKSIFHKTSKYLIKTNKFIKNNLKISKKEGKTI